MVFFLLFAVFFLFSVFSLPYLLIQPSKFSTWFAFSMICLLFALAYFRGPQQYFKKLTSRKHLLQSSTMVGSMVLSLFFSYIYTSYLLSLFFCVLEVISPS